MMKETYEELYDDEPPGTLQRLLYRKWRWIIAGVVALSFAIPFLIVNLSISVDNVGSDSSAASLLFKSAPQGKTSGVASSSVIKSGGRSPSVGGGGGSVSTAAVAKYTASGVSASSLISQNFTDFKGISENNAQLTSISLSNFYLDAEKFSLSLQNCSSLESIVLENILLIGNFSRVTLPKLTKFVYVQNGDDMRDSYKSPGTLQQTLFFDKVPPQQFGLPSWSVEQDLLNLGVDITISKGGTKLIDISRQMGEGEIYLNVKYCEDTLINVKGSYGSLTLINCNVTTASLGAIPGTLRYLNIRNSVQRTPHLADLIRKQTQLEELYIWLTFHCDWPGYELFLNINDLPLTMKRLGINNVDTTFLPTTPASSVKELTIGDYTTDTTISVALPKLFSSLERINIVNVSDPSSAAGYKIVHQAIQMKVKEIGVVNLHRNYSAAVESQKEIVEVEGVLDQTGIPKQPLSCFILRLNANSTTYTGRELSVQERHNVRYQGLGFDKMDSFQDYVKWDSLQ